QDLYAMALDGDRKPFSVATSEYNERDAKFSPDAQWIAYESNETGTPEIYAQAFPSTEKKIKISTNGGWQARWSYEGNELFYIALDERLMAVPFAAKAGEPVAGTPVPLFTTHVGGAIQISSGPLYDVTRNGRFVMDTLLSESTSPIEVIMNPVATIK